MVGMTSLLWMTRGDFFCLEFDDRGAVVSNDQNKRYDDIVGSDEAIDGDEDNNKDADAVRYKDWQC